jgi:beta-lactam-binding protein with PASTA domain
LLLIVLETQEKQHQIMLELLKNKKLYIHLSIIIGLGILILISIIFSLDNFTRHGEMVSVPDFRGYYYDELKDQAEFNKFRFVIIDSIYDASKEKGSIATQDPSPESLVKENRTIYLSVIAMNPEMVKMPNLIDLSKRNAISILETYGIKVKKLGFVENLAKDAVIEQKYREEEIEPGTEIIKGSGIELVLGLGAQKALIKAPLLIGLTRSQAIRELHLASLNLGEEHFEDGDDTTSVRIYRQVPKYSDKATVKMGESIELYYKSDKNFDFEQYLKTIKSSDNNTIYEDSTDTFIIEEEIYYEKN